MNNVNLLFVFILLGLQLVLINFINYGRFKIRDYYWCKYGAYRDYFRKLVNIVDKQFNKSATIYFSKDKKYKLSLIRIKSENILDNIIHREYIFKITYDEIDLLKIETKIVYKNGVASLDNIFFDNIDLDNISYRQYILFKRFMKKLSSISEDEIIKYFLI